MTLEELDPELAKGSEFTFVESAAVQVHQVKRQYSTNPEWTIPVLASRGVFKAAADHVAAGRAFYFISMTSCGPLVELSDRARSASDLAAFHQALETSKELRQAFDDLTATTVLGSEKTAYATLRGMFFEVHQERITRKDNALIAELMLTGATGHLMTLALGDVLDSNMGHSVTGDDLLAALEPHGICRRPAGSRSSVQTQVAGVTARWRRSVRRELLDPPIPRDEATELADSMNNGSFSLLVGTAGDGKSAVLEQTASALEEAGGTVLAFRLDRLGAFATTAELGDELSLDMSPVAALSLVAGNGHGYLLVDQLDAVSSASGRMPENFDAVADLVEEALLLPNVSVVLACRGFDLDNDHRIASLTARHNVTRVEVGGLLDAAVDAAVSGMELDPTVLTPGQRRLLRHPLHLVLLSGVASQPDALAFRSRGSLFEAFWNRKRQTLQERNVRFNAVVQRVATVASDQQTLSVPIEVLDAGELNRDAHILISEHVLAEDGGRVAFFHEAFFDYVFARQWVLRSESLVDFLCHREQELFRRAQVRQILQYLHELDHDRFLKECEALLVSESVRFHVKDTVIAVIANLPGPTAEESAMVLRVAATGPSYIERLWQQFRRPQWFTRFSTDGILEGWLDGPEAKNRDLGALFMGAQARDDPASVAALLKSRQSAANYPGWLRWTVRFADVESSRDMFDLLLAGVRAGMYDGPDRELWISVHQIGENQPLWAIELLNAYLVDRPDALTLDESGHVAALQQRDHYVSEIVRDSAAAEPLAFVEMALPYMRTVMAATARPVADDGLVRDEHFSHRMAGSSMFDREFDDALAEATSLALEDLATNEPETVRPWLEVLEADPYESSQYLLYRAMTAGSAAFADWAADLLLQGGARHKSGYSFGGGRWVARELLRSIAPHVDDEKHRQLEEVFRDLTNPHEKSRTRGSTAFMFLSALDEARLSPEGTRRLGEYRRKFVENEPPAPTGMTGGGVASPISSKAAELMTDEQWLQAMAKHNADVTNWDTGVGGSRELSSVFRERIAADPARFGRLALSMTPDLDDAYTSAMLMGLGESEFAPADLAVLFDAVRHLGAFEQSETARWLGWALQRHQRAVPLDLVELILHRALHATDPEDDAPRITWQDADGNQIADLHQNGINTTRGALAEKLGDLIIRESAGERTELVRPHLADLAADPVMSVRACVAHTIGASLRNARPDAIAAFNVLIDTDDSLLTAPHVAQLMQAIGTINPEVIEPVITRMLDSEEANVRSVGGELAGYAALEWALPDLLTRALALDAEARSGVASVCANNIDTTSNQALAIQTLQKLMHDPEPEVLKAVAKVAGRLRDKALRPFASLLSDLIASPAYGEATPQLFITLQHAPDRVDDLALKAAKQFINVFGAEAGDISTAAAGDTMYVSDLVVRGLAQSKSPAERAALLDVLDKLLEIGAYGIGDAIAASSRD
ncbi:hypothetical protein [Microbacterium sp.]|uniref:hypothetical protein n=1 Tax=Microbacterium sp. TaxID=51671 RepID=UPI0027363984|nr:hypothetical protein [Microbacterium sp.]